MNFVVVQRKAGERPREILHSNSETSAKQFVKKQMDLDRQIGLKGTRYKVETKRFF
ncbi:MAG: hypothetical protein UX13_C0006G0009 [Candidatus Woesebacteria bacterium GW2011_GWB1_45_5]|uniref:Uncharacterized protein n=1 Tax=Candidatus Woesebacteria bacterium GW2011_GWB1_45_5 TaxID=1618581 RepID=A0A0G1PYY3_9BACT|nr:MAG: hypothetical protein UX13_C0006G0009 [Candidatus Woesebacteria bacterium GW2011_GWB1_45_5]